MNADLFMELLYDFVHGVMPVHGKESVDIRERPRYQHEFYVGSVVDDLSGDTLVWTLFISGMIEVHRSYNATTAEWISGPALSVAS